MKKEHSIA